MVLGNGLDTYVFNKWANISTWVTVAIIGFFAALWMNFFMYSGMAEVNYQNFALDVVLNILIGVLVGVAVVLVSSEKVEK